MPLYSYGDSTRFTLVSLLIITLNLQNVINQLRRKYGDNMSLLDFNLLTNVV